jgi:GT2 family glycosyltransferase
VEYVKTTFPAVEILQNKKNLGFCKGNNIGIKYALEKGAEYLVFLNNDTKVERNWLTELVKTAEKEANIGACSSKIKMFDNTFLIIQQELNVVFLELA